MEENILYILGSILISLIVSNLIHSIIETKKLKPLVNNIDFFVGEYWKVGEISFISVFGIKIYKRVGKIKCILGINMGKNKND